MKFTVFLVGTLALASLHPVSVDAQTSPTSSAQDEIQDLRHSAQPGSLYFTGTHQGKPVHMVRTGLPGNGGFAIYTGPMDDRVRLTFKDGQGLQDILAVDKGYRITLKHVGEERVEYRLYAPNRKFMVGSVLYRGEGQRWMQGIMRSEAFPGYPALTHVSDISSKVVAQAIQQRPFSLAQWLPKPRGFELISSAHAEETLDDLVKGFFSSSAQQARDFFSAPGHEMVKASLVGAGAFTVKLIGQTELIAGGATTGAAVVALTPVLVSVGAGVAIGLAADKTYKWLESKNLGGASSVRDLFNRLTRRTPYVDAPPPEQPEQIDASGLTGDVPRPSSLSAPKSNIQQMLVLTEQLDRMDQMDFDAALQEAEACRRSGNFDCADKQLDKASKYAGKAKNKDQLAQSRQMVADDRRAAAEARRREEDRQRQLAEERRRAAEEAEQRRVAAAKERESGSGDMFGKMLWSAVGVGIIGSAKGVLSEDKVRIASGFVKDVMTDGKGQNIAAAAAESRAAAAARAGGGSRTAASGAGTAGASVAGMPVAASWREDYTIRENESGKMTRHDAYSTNIPGSVISGQMGSQSAAQAFYGSNGGNVISYSGCGSCGVGSTITVVVRYTTITDTHVYTRER